MPFCGDVRCASRALQAPIAMQRRMQNLRLPPESHGVAVWGKSAPHERRVQPLLQKRSSEPSELDSQATSRWTTCTSWCRTNTRSGCPRCLPTSRCGWARHQVCLLGHRCEAIGSNWCTAACLRRPSPAVGCACPVLPQLAASRTTCLTAHAACAVCLAADAAHAGEPCTGGGGCAAAHDAAGGGLPDRGTKGRAGARAGKAGRGKARGCGWVDWVCNQSTP